MDSVEGLFSFMGLGGSELFNTKMTSLSGYIQQISKLCGKKIVVKCGGRHLGDSDLMSSLCTDLSILIKLGVQIVIVHGGGPMLEEMLHNFGVVNRVIDSYRFTDEDVFNIAEMVFCGKIAPKIVSNLSSLDINTISLSGRDSKMILADKLRRVKKDKGSNIERIVDLGMVGEPISMNHEFFNSICSMGLTPVISPIGVGVNGSEYLMNADTVASFIAAEINADRLIILCDQDGLLDDNGRIMRVIECEVLFEMLKNGHFEDTMTNKIESIIATIRSGTKSVYITSGLREHSIMHDIIDSTVSIGTMVYKAADISTE